MGQWLSLINERNGLERLTAELTLKWVFFRHVMYSAHVNHMGQKLKDEGTGA